MNDYNFTVSDVIKRLLEEKDFRDELFSMLSTLKWMLDMPKDEN